MSAEPFHRTFYDVQDNQLVVGCYDIGIHKAIVFDGGAFAEPDDLRKLAAALSEGADWLDAERRAAA